MCYSVAIFWSSLLHSGFAASSMEPFKMAIHAILKVHIAILKGYELFLGSILRISCWCDPAGLFCSTLPSSKMHQRLPWHHCIGGRSGRIELDCKCMFILQKSWFQVSEELSERWRGWLIICIPEGRIRTNWLKLKETTCKFRLEMMKNFPTVKSCKAL